VKRERKTVIKNNADETLVCDSCGLPVQKGEVYVLWGLILGSLVLHVQCCYHVSTAMRNHLKRNGLEQQPLPPQERRALSEQPKRRPMVSEPTSNFVKLHKDKDN
jgi:hypothetical protein